MHRFLLLPQISVRYYGSITVGSKYSPNFKKYLQLADGTVGSYFHDVPLEFNAGKRTMKMVVEVPRWSNAKFEIAKNQDMNPITQDAKNGKPRFVHNLFPFHGYIHNYGALPQTWEDYTTYSSLPLATPLRGDNDPLDCCEIGSSIKETGSIKTVKVLGSLALIDLGELDWKLLVLDIEDPLASYVNDIPDVKKYFPGMLEATRTWFRDYKIPDGKPANQFAFDGEYRNAEETMSVVSECHEAWKRLVSGKVRGSELPHVRRAESGFVVEGKLEHEATIPKDYSYWHYVN